MHMAGVSAGVAEGGWGVAGVRSGWAELSCCRCLLLKTEVVVAQRMGHFGQCSRQVRSRVRAAGSACAAAAAQAGAAAGTAARLRSRCRALQRHRRQREQGRSGRQGWHLPLRAWVEMLGLRPCSARAHRHRALPLPLRTRAGTALLYSGLSNGEDRPEESGAVVSEGATQEHWPWAGQSVATGMMANGRGGELRA